MPFLLPITRSPVPQRVIALQPARLEWAIGVVDRPETERQSHDFDPALPQQLDEWIWFDETSAVLRPLTTERSAAHEPPHLFAQVDC